jgi:hypothetical protein
MSANDLKRCDATYGITYDASSNADTMTNNVINGNTSEYYAFDYFCQYCEKPFKTYDEVEVHQESVNNCSERYWKPKEQNVNKIVDGDGDDDGHNADVENKKPIEELAEIFPISTKGLNGKDLSIDFVSFLHPNDTKYEGYDDEDEEPLCTEHVHFVHIPLLLYNKKTNPTLELEAFVKVEERMKNIVISNASQHMYSFYEIAVIVRHFENYGYNFDASVLFEISQLFHLMVRSKESGDYIDIYQKQAGDEMKFITPVKPYRQRAFYPKPCPFAPVKKY